MKPTELRLGNYVYYDDNQIGRVISLRTEEYAEWDEGDDITIVVEDAVSGIILNCTNEEVNGIPVTEDMKKKYELFRHVNYLHQLQNCYFTVSHKELNCEEYISRMIG